MCTAWEWKETVSYELRSTNRRGVYSVVESGHLELAEQEVNREDSPKIKASMEVGLRGS